MAKKPAPPRKPAAPKPAPEPELAVAQSGPAPPPVVQRALARTPGVQLDFPANPTQGQVFNGWEWDTSRWRRVGGGGGGGPADGVTDGSSQLSKNNPSLVGKVGELVVLEFVVTTNAFLATSSTQLPPGSWDIDFFAMFSVPPLNLGAIPVGQVYILQIIPMTGSLPFLGENFGTTQPLDTGRFIPVANGMARVNFVYHDRWFADISVPTTLSYGVQITRDGANVIGQVPGTFGFGVGHWLCRRAR